MDFNTYIELYLQNQDIEKEFDDITDVMFTHILVEWEEILEEEEAIRRESVPGRRVVYRNIEEGHLRLMEDYFGPNPVYHDGLFRCRFRMRKPLFLRLMEGIVNHDPYFIQKPNCTGKLGLSPYQKVTAALRQLAYGITADLTGEYLRIGESTAILSMKRFCCAVVEVFGEEYLRSPNEDDVKKLMQEGEQRGFPGMLGSLDCMHWGWMNCPNAWQGVYVGKEKEPTIVLEAVASYDLWIWLAFFELPGSMNDINVLDHSSLFQGYYTHDFLEVRYEIDGKDYDRGYYLADGIYPNYSNLVKLFSCPQGEKQKYFVKRQESCRKDVERAFGVLQARFAILTVPARIWDKDMLTKIMKACIIMLNMIVEDERDDDIVQYERAPPSGRVFRDLNDCTFSDVLKRFSEVRDKTKHIQLLYDLIEHLHKKKLQAESQLEFN